MSVTAFTPVPLASPAVGIANVPLLDTGTYGRGKAPVLKTGIGICLVTVALDVLVEVTLEVRYVVGRELDDVVTAGCAVDEAGAAGAVKGAGPRRLVEVLTAGADGSAAMEVGVEPDRRLCSSDSTVSSRCSTDCM